MESNTQNERNAHNNNNNHHHQNFSDFIFPFTFAFQPQNPQQQQNHQTFDNGNNNNNGNNDNNDNNGDNGNGNNGNNGNNNHIHPPLFQFFIYPMPDSPREGPFIFFSPFFMPQEIPKNRHASEAALKKLPITKITQEHIDAEASCPICLDAFSFANNIDETNDLNIDTNIDTNEKMDIEDTQYVEMTTTNNNNTDKKEDCNNKVDQSTQTHEIVREMPCKHMFCESCLFKWLKQNVTCPLCRIEIESGDEQQKIPQTPPVSSSPLQTPLSSSSSPSSSPSVHEQLPSSNPSNTSIVSSAQNAIIDEDIIMEDFSTSSDNHHSHHSVNCSLASIGCCGEENQEHQVNEQQQISPMITLPQCQHHFHPNCLRTSLLVEGYSFDDDSSNANDNPTVYFRCPSCRTPAIVQRDLL